MLFSNTVLFLTVFTVAGSCMYIIAGWLALDGTLELFKNYGPVKDSGNPALDQPPQYFVHPKTGEWAPVNSDNRGNLVPQVFKGVQNYLIALTIMMTISCGIILVDNMWGKRSRDDRTVEKKCSRTSWSCNTGLTGYLGLLSLMWLVMVCFGVVPLVEWMITIQRCQDLENPDWSDGTTQVICIDLVQYGLVFFKETHNSGFAMICGPGGRYNPPRGDLKGFCENYYPIYSLYMTSFIGACMTLIALVLFFSRYVSQFGYLKFREWETQKPHPHTHNPHMAPSNGYIDPRIAYNSYGHSMHNPNYEHNMLLLNPQAAPSHADIESYGRKTPGREAMEMKERYYDSGDHGTHGSRKNGKKKNGPSSHVPEDATTYQRHPEKNLHHLSDGSVETPHPRDYASDISSKRPHSRSTIKKHPQSQPSSESEDSIKKPRKVSSRDHGDASDHSHSTVSFRPKPLKRKARGTRSEPDISRKPSRRATRKKPSSRVEEEYESPPSDFYLQEDMQRHLTSKRKNRSGSAY